MAERKRRVMLVGYFGPGALECSYNAAFREIGCEVLSFDIAAAERRYCRLGGAGRLFNKFVPVEPWIRKANREMVLEAQHFRPDVLVVFGQNRVDAGGLAQVQGMMEVATVYIWPDTLVNLSARMIAALPLYDLVATYSCRTIPYLERLGARRVEWIPLGADPHMHTVHSSSEARARDCCSDVAFIGQWRPEREHAVAAILAQLPGVDVKIWGPDWGRRCRRNRAILRTWEGRSLYEQDLAQAVISSKVNLNIIDNTNYPAANMRFFEIPCAGGLQVCSPCPEMEAEFIHGETVFYYRNVAELPELLRTVMDDEPLRQRVARAGHEKALKEHTYVHRARQILEMLSGFSA